MALPKGITDSKFLGGLTNDVFGPRNVSYVRDSRHSTYDFGQKGPFYLNNLPRQKFNYFINIGFNEAAIALDQYGMVRKFLNTEEQNLLIPLAKSVDLPGAKITTDRMNQYNHWKISQTKIDYDPITLTFHDVVDGKALRFWEMYYEYYFKDALDLDRGSTTRYPRKRVGLPGVDTSEEYQKVGSDDLFDPVFDQDFGYNIETVGNRKQLIKTISIFLVHAQKFTKVDLINPRVSDFTHDSLSYDDSGLIELSLTFEYEYFLYDNHFKELPESIITSVYGNSNHLELSSWNSKVVDTKSDYVIRDRTNVQVDTLPTGKEFEKDTSILGNLQENIGDLIADLPNALGKAASTGVMTGEFKFPLDPDAIKDQVIDNVKGQTKATGARNFGAAVKEVSDSFLPF